MKKNKLFIMGVMTLILTLIVVLIGCAEECNHSCIVAFDENGNRFNFSSHACNSGTFGCSSTCNVVSNWSNGARYKEVKCDCK
jgi:hypothetical protein